MTEAEALTKWCPYASSRVVTYQKDNTTRVNGLWDDTGNIRCIASACMAWRQAPPPEGESLVEAIRRHRVEYGSALMTAKNYVESHPEYRRRSDAPAVGYCGLAGVDQ